MTIAVALSLAALGTAAAWLGFRSAVVREGQEPSPSSGPAGDPWRDLQPGLHEFPPPPEARKGSAVTWTGSELVVWGGARDDEIPIEGNMLSPSDVLFSDGFAFDAATRSWEELPEAPLSPRFLATSVWTGQEVLIWGGWNDRDFFLDGAAYDPATRSWRLLPPAPMDDRMNPFSSVWTGSEMIVWATDASPREITGGAAYDPSSNSWRRIADAPLALLDGATIWTGDEMILLGPSLRSGGTVGVAYDPDADRWRELPARDWPGFGFDAVWTGTELVVVDRDNGAAYDPSADRWNDFPKVPLDQGGYVLRAAFAAGHILVVSDGLVSVSRLGDQGWSQLMIEADGYARDPISVGSAFLLIPRYFAEQPPAMLLWKPVTDPDWKSKVEGG